MFKACFTCSRVETWVVVGLGRPGSTSSQPSRSTERPPTGSPSHTFTISVLVDSKKANLQVWNFIRHSGATQREPPRGVLTLLDLAVLEVSTSWPRPRIAMQKLHDQRTTPLPLIEIKKLRSKNTR